MGSAIKIAEAVLFNVFFLVYIYYGEMSRGGGFLLRQCGNYFFYFIQIFPVFTRSMGGWQLLPDGVVLVKRGL